MRRGVGRRTRAALVAALGTAAALALLACEEAPDLLDFVGPGPRGGRVEADFLPDAPPPGVTDHVVSLRKSGGGGAVLTLDVVITEVPEDVSGIRVALEPAAGFGALLECGDGDLFRAGACDVARPDPFRTLVIVERLVQAPDAPIRVGGSRVILRLKIAVLDRGQSDLQFLDQNGVTVQSSALLDVNGAPITAVWIGGTLVGS